MSELVISYLFPPSKDVAGMALAKRYIAKNIKFDILQANDDDCDYEFLEYMNEYINDQIILDMKCNPNHTKCMEKFVNEGMSKIKDRKYDKITSVAWKVANHFLALEYKLEHPDTFWTAEFTDPISFDIYNKKREGGKRSTVTDADYIGKINREIEKVNLKNNTEFPLLDESANIYLLVEYIAFLFADQIRFTNIHQRDVMLKQFPCDIKSFVEKKSVIEDFPPLPSRFYEIKETSDLDDDYINIGYFGNYYSKRHFESLFKAFDLLNHQHKSKLRFHFYLVEPDLFKTLIETLEISENIIIKDTVNYLDFLNLTTKFDVLIVNDLMTQDTFDVNPYLPSKYSDYKGSNTDIWIMSEKNSMLDSKDEKYNSSIYDWESNCNVLIDILKDNGFGDDEFSILNENDYEIKRTTDLNKIIDEKNKEINQSAIKINKNKKELKKLKRELKKLKKENSDLKNQNSENLSSSTANESTSYLKLIKQKLKKD